jgi:hypothetical protein
MSDKRGSFFSQNKGDYHVHTAPYLALALNLIGQGLLSDYPNSGEFKELTDELDVNRTAVQEEVERQQREKAATEQRHKSQIITAATSTVGGLVGSFANPLVGLMIAGAGAMAANPNSAGAKIANSIITPIALGGALSSDSGGLVGMLGKKGVADSSLNPEIVSKDLPPPSSDGQSLASGSSYFDSEKHLIDQMPEV